VTASDVKKTVDVTALLDALPSFNYYYQLVLPMQLLQLQVEITCIVKLFHRVPASRRYDSCISLSTVEKIILFDLIHSAGSRRL